MNKTSMYLIVAVVVIVIIVGGVLAYVLSRPGGGNTMDLYASEYKFGTSAGSMSSPGPTLTFTSGQTYTITLHNVGTMLHNFAIVTTKADESTSLAFSGAQIGSTSNPIVAGGTGSCTFTAGTAGSYYYICQVDGHVSLGMWGTVTVNP
jgi:uncharacterized cupredoxin-like copper-binding protein